MNIKIPKKPQIKTVLLPGIKPSAGACAKIINDMGLPPDMIVNCMIFKVSIKNNIYYCCWSSGELENGEAMLTAIGAFNLAGLGCLDPALGKIYIKELKLGKIPLQKKVFDAFNGLPNGAKVCFVGDMNGELDGLMAPAFNLNGNKLH